MSHSSYVGHCQCGKTSLAVTGRALFRAYCHCLICQEFNQADYADITVFRARDVGLADEAGVAFRVYQQPPLVQRGTCKHCGKPAMERLNIPLMPRMTVIPTPNIRDWGDLPKASFHMFYHRRRADMRDDLPKYSGFLNSQMHFGTAAMLALLRGR